MISKIKLWFGKIWSAKTTKIVVDAKTERAQKLTNDMVLRGLLTNDPFAIETQIAEIMKWGDDAYESMCRVVAANSIQISGTPTSNHSEFDKMRADMSWCIENSKYEAPEKAVRATNFAEKNSRGKVGQPFFHGENAIKDVQKYIVEGNEKRKSEKIIEIGKTLPVKAATKKRKSGPSKSKAAGKSTNKTVSKKKTITKPSRRRGQP